MNWRSPRRGYIAATFGGYIIVLVITAIFFVPELMAITGTPYNAVADPSLTARAKTWEMLSLVRLAFLLVLAVILQFGLTKDNASSKP